MEVLTKDEKDFIDNFWLGVTHTNKQVKNVFKNKTFDENPAYYLVSFMADPDNFAFTCKHLFNIELLPVQLVILKELWYRPFPMFIASRGFGKCITGDSFIQTDKSFYRIGDLIGEDFPVQERKYFDNLGVLNEKGLYNNIEYGWNNGYSPTIKIKTKQGFELEGTPEHPIRVTNNENIEWKELQDLSIGTYIPISRNENWINNPNDLPEDLSYWFGLLIGDGGYTIRGKISFTSKDEELHKSFREIAYKYFNKQIKNSSQEITKSIYSTEVWDELFSKYGFNSPTCGLKDVPKSVLSASKKSVAAFIRGLMDTDGCFTRVGIEYCSKSEKLAKALQFLLLKFGVISRVKKRLNKKYHTNYYYLYIFGKDLEVFNKNIGFGLRRKQDKIHGYLSSKQTFNTNKDIIPNSLVHCLKSNKKNYTYNSLPDEYKNKDWYKENYFFDEIVSIEKKFNQTFDVHCKHDHSFISNGIISHNTFLLALYSLLRILFTPGAKVVITGAAFRQSKYVFEYMQTIYENSPVLRDILSYNRNNGPKRDIDRCIFRAGPSKCTALPIGDGKRIRGERASHLLAEEYASINPEVYEQVIAGFAAVSSTPVLNVKNLGKIEALKVLGKEHLIPLIKEDLRVSTNQSVICGTPDFEFGHFCKYWKRYKKIIQSRGNVDKLSEILGDEVNASLLDYRDYSIIRLPWTLAPKGLMEEKTIIRAKSTMHKSLFDMEYNAIFVGDTEGFFRRSLLERCVCKIENQIKKSCGVVNFTVASRSSKKAKYVMGVDPASERDNFSVVVLELWPDHRRIVYCWTTTRARFKAQLKKGSAKEHDFYRHCARKILDLTKVFNIEYIGIDAQGGGISVEEALGDPSILQENEKPIFPIIEEDDEKYTDDLDGRHILVTCQFANSVWLSDANHGMKKDFEERALLFPNNDSSVLGLLLEDDKAKYQAGEEDFDVYDFSDKLEDISLEVDDLLYELTTIQHSKTNSGRERWDTPEIKDDSVKKKGRLVKDRYSALLIANKIARDYIKSLSIPKKSSSSVGGLAHKVAKDHKKTNDEPLYVGPAWFTDQVKNSVYGRSVKRGY